MPDRRGNRRSQNQGQRQDEHDRIPFYNARLFSMYESLIQSYTHFTYHSNHMFHVLERALHGTQNSINSNPYPWLNPQPQQPQPHQPQQPHPQPQPQPHQQPHPQPRQPMNAWRSVDVRTPPPLRTPLENNIVNALMGMLYPPEEQRLTQAELNERIEFTQYQNLTEPLYTVCSITQDTFEPTQRVARIRHCGHIFNSDSLMEWLRINNTCPTCRHNLRTSPTTATTATTDATRPLQRGISIPLESEININSFYNELLRNSGNLPGFELNTVNDDSIVFSFDLMNRRPSTNGSSSSGASGASGSTGPRNIE